MTLKGQTTVKCTTDTVKASENMTNYETFVQICPISQIEFDETFAYSVFGWAGKTVSLPFRFTLSWIETSLKDPRSATREFNLVVLADWGVIEEKLNEQTPIMPYLQREVANRKIDGIIINGDVAYDLDFKNGAVY